MYLGAIEAGGTKMICAIGTEKGQLLDRVSIPTEDPESTLGRMLDYFKTNKYKIDALGIACFGPVELRTSSPKYGYITSTPKEGWADTDFAGYFKRGLDIPVGFDTDVNGAILGEVTYGAAMGVENALYITVGTGIGVGVFCGGRLVHGMMHPEGGHILMRKHPEDDFHGICPFHGDCLEGLSSGPAIEKRWGLPGHELTDNEKVWELESFYLGQAIADYILVYSPEKIILWGGVMHQPGLFELVRKKVKEFLNGYICSDIIMNTDLSDYIVAPGCGENAGIAGALRLACPPYCH